MIMMYAVTVGNMIKKQEVQELSNNIYQGLEPFTNYLKKYIKIIFHTFSDSCRRCGVCQTANSEGKSSMHTVH